MRLKGSVVAITGAGGGIGRVIALAFAAEGAACALADVDDGVRTVAADARSVSGVNAIALRADVT